MRLLVVNGNTTQAVTELALEEARHTTSPGTALTGMARRLQPAVAVPLRDGIACAVRQAESLVRARFPPAFHTAAGPASGVTGVSPELAALLESQSTPKER